MVTGLNASNGLFINSVNILQAQLNSAEAQLASGLRVNQASDAPQAVGDIFQARSDLAGYTQTIQNLNLIKAQVDTGDQSVQTAVQLLQNAVSLGTQGASTVTTQSQRNNLASQVKSIIGQLVGLTSTQVNGIYIFSGDASSTAPYQVNTASPTGVDRLVTAAATQQASDPTGITFQTGMTAQDLFDKRDAMDNPAPENAFAALNNLQLALQAGDTTAIADAVGSINTASTWVNQQLSFYGAAQNRISAAIDLAQKFQVQTQTNLSNLQDTDVAGTAVRVTQLTTALNAAMAAQAKRPTSTLFDYLPITGG